MARKYRKVLDNEISPYMGLHEVGSPQYHRAQNKKRADVRRNELPQQEFNNEPVVIAFVLSLVTLAFILVVVASIA